MRLKNTDREKNHTQHSTSASFKCVNKHENSLESSQHDIFNIISQCVCVHIQHTHTIFLPGQLYN